MDFTRKWVHIIAVLCVILYGMPVRTQAAAQDPIRIQNIEHSFGFGHQVRFHLEATSSTPIQSIVLAYRTSDTQGTTIEMPSFSASTSVSVDHVHEISHRYIRPFVEITYWWTIGNEAGDKLTTEPRTFSYTDNRFEWQTLSQDNINIYWYQGEIKIAQLALDVAIEGAARARQDIHLESVQKPADIYLYANADDLHLALPAGLPMGADALTLYETNVILVPHGPQADQIPALRRIVPHEVTHALIHEATQNDFDRVPLWLSEGLATSVEYTFAPDPDAQLLLEDALKQDRLIDLNSLCAAFPRDTSSARIAYAQSASVVDYIRDLYGRQMLSDLVAAYADGATCEGGVQRVFGFSLDRLETSWKEELSPLGKLTVFWKSNGAWLILLALFAVIPLLFVRPARPPIKPLGRKTR